uniref:DNA repair protein complementing XP-C cells-like protein n=1 Tax=Magallana gigas TaxID=29159 RepID=K1QQ52_MAGGI
MYYFFCCRKKKGFDWKVYVQRQINRFNKELTEDIHKVHLMCLLMRGRYLNQVCNNPVLRGVALSLVPSEMSKVTVRKFDVSAHTRLMNWFREAVSIDLQLAEDAQSNLVQSLMKGMETRKVANPLEYVLVYLIMIRCLGVRARLVTSLQPLPLKNTKKVENTKKINIKGNPAAIKKPIKSKSDSKAEGKLDTKSKKKGTTGKKPERERKKQKASKPDSVSHASSTLKTKNKNLRKRGSKVRPDSYHDNSDVNDSDEDFEPENVSESIDCIRGHVNRPYRIESAATQPVHYVVAYNEEGEWKDVTARYASKWMTETRKLRVDPEWWSETLGVFRCEEDSTEDEEIKANLMKRPLPTSVSAYKSHPLYALRRHLLKYEAIYPETAAPLGYIRGEPVYARECVHELHSRENWLKEGRAVRIGEEAYKMVKSRAKWNKPKVDPEALDLELFGMWQTEEYIPPPAVDGKVPRNAYGNIELFKPSMLPAGTVYLKVPGLNKVAKKLNMDCVPAMVGWDSHCGFSHPVLEGFVVCEEHKDILLAAWDEEQEIQKQKEAEKKEKRAVGNWKLLIKGLLIKERIKKRFNLMEKGWNLIMYEHHAFLLEANVFKKESTIWHTKPVM